MAWLQFSIDAAVALLKPRWIPRQIEVHEVRATGLKIDSLPRRICANKNSYRLNVRIGVESALYLLAFVRTRCTTENANSFIRLFRVCEPQRPLIDALIADIGLPGMSGIDLVHTMRQRAQHVPTILITGRTETHLEQDAGDLRVLRFLTKPFDTSELLYVLAGALSSS